MRAAFVVGLPDDERDEVVGAMVCADPGVDLDPAVLADRLRREVAGYKVPRRILVVDDEDLPLLPSGKVSLPAVVERLQE